MPSHIQVSRYADQCGRLFGIRGMHASECLDDVFPTLNINDPDPRLVYLRDEERYCGVIQSPAGGAGTYAWCSLSNTDGTDRLVHLLGIEAWAAAAGSGLFYVERGAGGANPAHPTPLDGRLARPAGATHNSAYPGNGSNVGAALGLAYFPIGTTIGTRFALDIVLPPNSRALFCTTLANAWVTVQFYWSERSMNPDEKSFEPGW